MFMPLKADELNLGRKRRKLIPKGRKRVAYRRMMLGLMFLGLYVFFSGSFSFAVTIQAWFAQKSILYR